MAKMGFSALGAKPRCSFIAAVEDSMPTKNLVSYGLLLFIPVAIVAEHLEWGR